MAVNPPEVSEPAASTASPTATTVPSALPLLSPTALCADAGDGRVYLRWNPQVEDPRVVGWRVWRLSPGEARLTDQPLGEPAHVVTGLSNGQAFTFAVSGVLADGSETPRSNTASATPRATGQARVEPLNREQKLTIGAFADLSVGASAVRITFPDGQELVYDNYRPIDWKARDGRRLIYPKHFGNGVDIGEFDARGLPVVIPAQGTPPDGDEPAPPAHMGRSETPDHPQKHAAHPAITTPLTLPLSQDHHDARPSWREPVIDGDRVTVHYWQPLTLMGYRSWNYVLVWETWWPIERERHGTTYHGLARLVEVQMPSAHTSGYQVMLNNGLGPDGSRKGVASYSVGFRNPGVEIVDYSGDKNQRVIFQSPKQPRQGYGYHPNQDCLQSHPLIFYDWADGSMTVSARHLYYHASNNSSSYVEEGADGVWPNLSWDLAAAGRRTAVDVVEYLYAPAPAQPLPQRYLNARAEVYADVSRRMGVQDRLPAVSMYASMGEVKRDGGPEAFAQKKLPFVDEREIDAFAVYHDFWHAVPYAVPDEYRFDANHGINPQLRKMSDVLRAAGQEVGFWYRAEVVKTSIANLLSETIPTAEMYYGYRHCEWPSAVDYLKEQGIPAVRPNTRWVRRQRDGSWPVRTPYQWVPMSMAGGWWETVMWPTLHTSRELGFTWVLQDGGFGGLQGVDYAPMLAGDADAAVPAQPYWWRLFRTMKHLGISHLGECTLGWKGASVNIVGPGDEHFLWMYSLGWTICDRTKVSEQQLHKLYQLYNCAHQDMEGLAVRRFAKRFYTRHGPPDWVELVDLKQGDPVEVTAKVGASPVAGISDRTTEADTVTFTVRPWTWTDTVWHYTDGRSVAYPAYEKVDWTKE